MSPTPRRLGLFPFSTSVPYRGSFVTGLYYGSPQTSGSTSAGMGVNLLRVHPFVLSGSTAFDRIACEVTSVGEAGSLVRMGAYADNGNGYPGALLFDAGTVAGDVLSTTTPREITISQTLSGVVWLAAAIQVVSVTSPTLRTVTNASMHVLAGQTTTIQSTATTGYSHSSVSGALPANFTGTVTSVSSAPRILLRKA